MARHKLLKGIAHGIIDSFMGRNNDIDGYWGPGKLYQLAIEQGVKELTLDLLRVSGVKAPRAIQFAEEQYRQQLAKNLKKAGIDRSAVRSALIVIAFETHRELEAPVFYTRGEPFLCAISITSGSGQTYEAVRVGRCAPHNPDVEHRRVGADSLTDE